MPFFNRPFRKQTVLLVIGLVVLGLIGTLIVAPAVWLSHSLSQSHHCTPTLASQMNRANGKL